MKTTILLNALRRALQAMEGETISLETKDGIIQISDGTITASLPAQFAAGKATGSTHALWTWMADACPVHPEQQCWVVARDGHGKHQTLILRWNSLLDKWIDSKHQTMGGIFDPSNKDNIYWIDCSNFDTPWAALDSINAWVENINTGSSPDPDMGPWQRFGDPSGNPSRWQDCWVAVQDQKGRWQTYRRRWHCGVEDWIDTETDQFLCGAFPARAVSSPIYWCDWAAFEDDDQADTDINARLG
jgi:hypothetical protein